MGFGRRRTGDLDVRRNFRGTGVDGRSGELLDDEDFGARRRLIFLSGDIFSFLSNSSTL